MRKIYYFLLVLVMMMMGTVAKAQDAPKLSELNIVKEYTMTLNFLEGKTSDGTFTTTLDGLYDALGTTAEEFDATSHGNFWTQVVAEGAWVDELQTPDAAAGGAWFGRYTIENATVVAPQGWGTQVTVGDGDEATQINTSVYYLQDLAVTNSEMSVKAGSFGEGAQGPILVEGDTDYAYLYIVYGTNAAKVKVQVNITNPSKGLPEPETSLEKLTIVKDYELKLPFTVGKSYEGKTYTATLTDLYTELGVEDAASFDAAISDFTFTQVVKSEETAEGSGEYTYTPINDLQLPANASGGAWFGRYTNYDEDSGSEVTLPMSYPKEWNANCTFYTQEIKLADREFSLVSGQYPGTLKEGDTDYTYLYIIYGDKAARVKVYVEMTKPEEVDPDKMVKVEEELTLNITQEPLASGYATQQYTFDVAKVAELLGCETSDIDTWKEWASEVGGAMVDYSDTNDGYLGANGFPMTWSDGAIIYIQPVSLSDGTFLIGQRGGYGAIAEATLENPLEIPVQLLFTYGQNYVVLNINLTIAPDGSVVPDPDSEFGEIVATIPLRMELKPTGQYYGERSDEEKAAMELDLNIENIKTLLGEGTYNVFGLQAPTSADVYSKLTEGTGYGPNTGFNSGFWMARPVESLGEEYATTSFVGTWGNNSYGIEWKLNDGIFGFDENSAQSGETFNSTFYWALADKSKAIKYQLTVVWTDDPHNSSEDVTIVQNIQKEISITDLVNDSYAVDQEEILALLGGENPLEDADVVEVKIATSAATFKTIEDGSSEVVDANGYVLDVAGDLPEGVTSVGFDSWAITFDQIDVPFAEGDESVAYARFAFDYQEEEGSIKRVLYTVRILSANSPITGIANVEAAEGPATYYTLGGAVATPVKGFYLKKQGTKVEKIYVK